MPIINPEKVNQNKDLPKSKEQWTREPLTHKEFANNILELTLEMPTEEIDRRLRASNPDYPGPFIKINKKKYTLRPEKSSSPFIYGN